MANKKKPKVVISERLEGEPAKWLARRAEVIHASYEDTPALQRALKSADGLVVRTYTKVDDKLLKAAPKLKVVGRAGVGIENISVSACTRHDVRVVSTPAANTQAVVEYVFALIADAVRPRLYLDGYIAPPRYHEHRREHLHRQLNEMVLGVLGMGRIGRRVAEVAHAIGMRVIYNDLLTRRELKLPDDDPSEFVDSATLWAEADILTIHVDGRRSNRRLIDKGVLMALKPTCIVINAARGMLVNDDDLRTWSKIAEPYGGMAVLDVQDPEPPPDDYPLFGLPNVKVLPHLASRTHTGIANMNWVVRDVVAVLEGKEPEYPAN